MRSFQEKFFFFNILYKIGGHKIIKKDEFLVERLEDFYKIIDNLQIDYKKD